MQQRLPSSIGNSHTTYRLKNMAHFIVLLLNYFALGSSLMYSAKAEAFQQKDTQNNVDSLTGAAQTVPIETTPLMSYTELRGGEINNEQILRYSESPFVVRNDIQITKSGSLIIEPGVTMEFAPGAGIAVEGTLKAVGTPSSRIIMTAQGEQTMAKFELLTAEEKRIRLVDGPNPLAGRVELYHKGSWRAVCTNSRNWTAIDFKVACTQLGFRGGQFWNWVERAPGYMPRLLYESPGCKGHEKHLQECGWQTRQLGSGVCDYHSDIGIQCQPIHAQPINYWRGLMFHYAPFSKSLANNNIVYSALSKSTLKYVTIYKAGLGPALTATSAIEVLGQPPVMEHVVISHSAYTGFNVTRPNEGFTMKNVTVRDSNGIGVFVNSSQGNFLMEKCNIEGNADDGVKYVSHDLRAEERRDRASIYDFCTLPTTSGQTYPISLTFTQKYYAGSEKECGKYFFTKPGFLLTVHFEYFSLKNNETVQIQIFDGATSNDRLLFEWKARNYTRPQSVTSTREKLFIKMKADAREESNGFLRLTSGRTSAYDVRIVDSVVEDNAGRGVAIDNIRSKLHIDGTTVSGNGRVAGVHVTSGAGDVNITSSKIGFNNGNGVNITYYGGNRNISRSALFSNKLYGFAVWLNETQDINRQEFIPFNQTTVVEYSQITSNIETGILHGNYCEPIWVNITGNTFNSSFNNDINIGTCWRFTKTGQPNLNLQIGHNTFEFSKRDSIFMSPVLNTLGRIEYNNFFYGSYGAIYFRNDYIFPEFNLLPVRLIVQSNYFIRNKGVHVVSLGLSPYSRKDVQSLLFTRNFLRENKIKEPFGPPIDGTEGSDGAGRLNPRSRVAAPVIVASSNIDIYRNILHNLDSTYEIGSQLCDQSQTINATYNWLGHTDENKIYARLFHRNDRYNLARIEYLPYLLHNSNPGSTTIIERSTMVPRFYDESNNRIGGEVDGQEMIPAGTYTVTKDINIRPGGRLILQPGVTLQFEPSVGMMIAGKLEARGRRPDNILFTLKRETVIDGFTNSTVEEVEDIDGIDMETESILEPSNDPPRVPVRLLGGTVPSEGRLQLYLDGRWGTVCDYGWTVINAALACNQLGFTLNPTDWRLFRSEMPMAGIDEDVIVSNIQCNEQDTDITKCRSERFERGEFENSCSHQNDVGIRCYEGAWAGIRFSMLAERADLQYITIEKAGLFDYTTNSFKPAIQMDFARHNLDSVRVVDNLHDGLGVIYSDIYAGKSVNNIKNSEFVGNRGSGISFKQLEMRIQGSIIKNNRGSGISHNSVISAVDQNELAGWFKLATDNTFDLNYNPYVLPKDSGNIDLGPWEQKYIRTEELFGGSMSRKIFVRCPAGYVLGIQLLNPINVNSTEQIVILDSQTENDRSDVWSIKRDLNVFPITSSSYGIILYYDSGSKAYGGAVLLLSTVSAPVQSIRNRIVRGTPPSLVIRSTKIQKNQRGISAFYYNRYYGDEGEYYLRKANESIKIVNSDISYNVKEAIYVKSPFWDVQSSNLSEITIHVNGTMITQNGRGIRQMSKDLRSSNNLFHYVLQDSTIEENAVGGFQVSLPYVWQYNENFTHSVYFGNTTWQRNKRFGVSITGHYAVLNMTQNVFLNNVCPRGVIALDGMEKRIKFDYNRFENNNAKFIMEFKADSLSEIVGDVPARVEYNNIKRNTFEDTFGYYKMSHRHRHHKTQRSADAPTAVIRLEGIQNVILYRNLLADNKMEYNLVAGLMSARLDNYFFATENWWGSKNVDYIQSKIFGFDNWNNYADVIYQPYLIEDSFDASVSIVAEPKKDIDIATFKGGRIYKDLVMRKRPQPYHITSDITVMPGVTLNIQHGVQMEFDANVGILVLGSIVAIGYKESEIVMKPFKNSSHEPLRMLEKRSLEDMTMAETADEIRLCISSNNCTSDTDSLYGINEGFLEYFNHTTLQWVPICDSRFTERNAQVVCRELGYDPANVYYGHDRRIEYHTNSLTRIWTWVQPLECKGDEAHMNECSERLNGQLYGHRHECKWDDVFVFVSCNEYPEQSVYWGGIRFANSKFEENQYENRFHDSYTHISGGHNKESHLEFVRLENAGMLHNRKSAAVQAVFKNPKLSSVTILNSAHHGINFVAPTGAININYANITNAFGTGINIFSITGEGRESDESSFTPLKKLDLPYKLFSMVDICDPQKAHIIEERVIVYYKYDNNPVNCVKIFTSAFRAKPVGFRLLQSNLFNHSKLYGRADSIRLFDGDIYNVTSLFIDKIEYDSRNQRSFFKSTGPTLSLQLIASGAPEYHGFIAEIVTVPISTIGQYRDALHNVTNSHIARATKGAISYLSAGEITPTLTLASNRLQNNCKQLYGNFSTCESAVSIDVQNMNSFYFMNNLLLANQGGLKIRADSRGSATSLRGIIQHNLMLRNRNRPALYVEGRQSSPYQEVVIYRNYFAQNEAGYEDVIKLRQVVSNFSYNYVHANIGGRIVEVSGFEKVRLPIYQTTSHNSFYGNVATDFMGRATIVAGTAGQKYVDNIFENPENDYEMMTINNTVLNYDLRNSTIEHWRSKIDARYNYWSYNNTISVQSRIRDILDDQLLLEVQAVPFQMNNETIVDGKCPPGWNLVHDTCYIYVGAPMSFHEARAFCRSENASMPFIRTESSTVWNYLQSQMQHLKYPEKVWVQHLNHIDRCTSFLFREVEIEDCNEELGFLCESDPKVVIDPLSWRADIFAVSIISAFILVIILLLMVGFCWFAKSKHRHTQRLQRRNSIRQSLRSLNSIDAQGSLRRKTFATSESTGTLTKNIAQDYRQMVNGNGSIDSMDKSVLSSEASFEGYDAPNGYQRQPQYNEYVNQKVLRPDNAQTRVATIGSASKALSSRGKAAAVALDYHDQNADMFELSYRNEGFRDNSTIADTTRNNSGRTSIAEDAPIIHQTDVDDNASDYYGNASTLPLRPTNNENLSFLAELKRNLPEYYRSNDRTHTSFLPNSNSHNRSNNNSHSSTLPYEQKIDQLNFTPLVSQESLIRNDSSIKQPPDMRRPDSYYTAVRSSKAPVQLLPMQADSKPRPKTVYQTANENTPNSTYHRSKSEALLETDFDEGSPNILPLNTNGRSYSQPLETAM